MTSKRRLREIDTYLYPADALNACGRSSHSPSGCELQRASKTWLGCNSLIKLALNTDNDESHFSQATFLLTSDGPRFRSCRQAQHDRAPEQLPRKLLSQDLLIGPKARSAVFCPLVEGETKIEIRILPHRDEASNHRRSEAAMSFATNFLNGSERRAKVCSLVALRRCKVRIVSLCKVTEWP